MRLVFNFEKVLSTGDLKTKIAKKIAILDRYLKNVSSDLRAGVVKLSRGERWGYRVKVGLKLPGKDIVAETKDKELLTAVDQVVDKLRVTLVKKVEKERKSWKRR